MTLPTSFFRLFFVLVVTVPLSTALMAGSAADPDHEKQLRQTGSCERCDLRDADLGGVKAELGDLTNADLRGATMYKALLRHADLTGALLVFTNLKGADLLGARGVNFDGAITNEQTTCPGGEQGPCQ